MIIQSQAILILNLIFVFVVFFLIRKMMKAVKLFNWNPGDGDIQTKQKFVILKTIVFIACTTILAAIVNAYFV